jgi:hypothetical protein
MLQHANQLFINGDYAEATQAFERLANGAEERFSERAPFLYLEAGRSAILADQTVKGVAHYRRGLTLLASQGRHHRMRLLAGRITDDLRARGLADEAKEIAGLLDADLPDLTTAAAGGPAAKPLLPTHCPNCGGALRPDEVEWLDEVTAECAYCGSPVRSGT